MRAVLLTAALALACLALWLLVETVRLAAAAMAVLAVMAG